MNQETRRGPHERKTNRQVGRATGKLPDIIGQVSNVSSNAKRSTPNPMNSPSFDGGPHAADTVCFELFDADGVKILQWSAYVSAGNVEFRGFD